MCNELFLLSSMDRHAIFITGATGFLGAHVCCLLLKQGCRVTALSRHEGPFTLFDSIHSFYQLPAAFQPNWVVGDLLDMESLLDHIIGVECVFHCAGKISFAKKDVFNLIRINVLGSRNIVNACLFNGVKKIVHVSSIASLGGVHNGGVITEDSDWDDGKFNSNYAKSKYLSEQEMWRGKVEGLDVGIVNPGIILGLGDGKTGSNQLYTIIHKQFPFYAMGGSGFVGVEDVAKHMLLVYEKGLWGKRHICVSENLSYKQLFEQLAETMGKKPPHIALKGPLLSVLFRLSQLCEFLHIPFPIPSENILGSSATAVYKTINENSLHEFHYTPIRSVNYYALLALGLLNKETSMQHN